MGITGLIPFLEKSSKKTNISEFAGKAVAIDTYCWLHKGAFSCADKIVMGQQTDAYVKYCMKFVNMLLGHNIKPILVFDGRHLPAKAETEVKRRESREANRKRAAELIKMGKITEGKNLLRRSLDVSHKMALEVMKECQAHNVDCIVAPYEADAQLAYLNISGIVDVVITEDSDLTLFGCKKIFFKMDMYGYGVLVEQDRLHLAMGLRLPDFHMDKFRHMCILSGCDYLASLPGIGLNKACKFIVKNTDDNIYNALLRLASSLNMKSLVVTKEYRDGFMRALATFKHQLVYCPLQRKQVRLNPLTPDITEEQLTHAGSEVDEQLAWQLALGNCDPFSKEMLHNFDPDKPRLRRTNSWSETAIARHQSIWSQTFKVKEAEEKKPIITPKKERQLAVKTPSTRGKVVVLKTDYLKKDVTPRKRTFEESEMEVDEIIQMYKDEVKSPTTSAQAARTKTESEVPSTDDEKTSPILVKRSNPFKKMSNSNEVSPSLLHRIRRRLPIKSRLKATVIDDTAVVQSQFFAPESGSKLVEENEPMDLAEPITTNSDKENVDSYVKRIIIPETEEFEEDDLSKVQGELDKDSGYKGSSVERELSVSTMSCDDSISEKKPLQSVDNVTLQNIDSLKVEFNEDSMRVESSEYMKTDEDDMEFSITRQVFTETRSSMFKYENPVKDKRLKRDNESQNIQRLSQSSQGTSSRRGAKTNSKKTAIIQGQQSLLNMFGFQKKNALQH
ncbi:exonuclease 1 [Nasonia vitripennis]|uniref:Exonuclease 1 n=1 Tax=Nasonia vitripennis TaxID=7425 RepID=A0A7M7G4L8_NASVI|nr:exonuclease 1 [Nasonia vitripennis]